MSRISWSLIVGVALATLGFACGDSGSATELNPDGPPMVRQLILTERYTSTSGASLTRPVIAFGHHPDATAEEQHTVTAVVAASQRFRVVIDELLVGNYLEEVQCNEQVDDDFFAAVPLGATPDDIAKCAGTKEQVAQTCKGDKAVCVRASDGVAVGVRDEQDAAGQPYRDGIADATQFIAGAAGVQCGSLSIPMNLTRSYWQPSGNQQRPAVEDGLRGLLSLGPAVVLVPSSFLPTDQLCTIVFGESVVDKSGLRPCAPPDGDVTASCAPGDTTATEFRTEPLLLLQQSPLRDAIGVPRAGDLTVRANVGLAVAISVVSEPPAAFSVTRDDASPQTLVIRPTAPLQASTRYVVSVPLRDGFGFGPTAPAQLTFTTGN